MFHIVANVSFFSAAFNASSTVAIARSRRPFAVFGEEKIHRTFRFSVPVLVIWASLLAVQQSWNPVQMDIQHRLPWQHRFRRCSTWLRSGCHGNEHLSYIPDPILSYARRRRSRWFYRHLPWKSGIMAAVERSRNPDGIFWIISIIHGMYLHKIENWYLHSTMCRRLQSIEKKTG